MCKLKYALKIQPVWGKMEIVLLQNRKQAKLHKSQTTQKHRSTKAKPHGTPTDLFGTLNAARVRTEFHKQKLVEIKDNKANRNNDAYAHAPTDRISQTEAYRDKTA